MLGAVMAHHPQLLALHEALPHLNVEAFARWKGDMPVSRIEKSIRSKRDTPIRAADLNGLVYVESSHYCSHLIPELYTLYDARFIFLHRDGREFTRSGLERGRWYKDDTQPTSLKRALKEYAARWLRRNHLINIGHHFDDHRLIPPKQYESRIEKIAWLWTEINQTILQGLDRIPEQDVMTLSLRSFDASLLRSIFDFIGVESSDDLISSAMDTARDRPNKTSSRSVPPFESWELEDRRRFWSIAGPLMGTLGYEVKQP